MFLASPILVGIWADLPEVGYLMSPYMAHIQYPYILGMVGLSRLKTEFFSWII